MGRGESKVATMGSYIFSPCPRAKGVADCLKPEKINVECLHAQEDEPMAVKTSVERCDRLVDFTTYADAYIHGEEETSQRKDSCV